MELSPVDKKSILESLPKVGLDRVEVMMNEDGYYLSEIIFHTKDGRQISIQSAMPDYDTCAIDVEEYKS